MPVPFRDAQDIAESGTAAYLRIERTPAGVEFRGGLLVVNARGEPLQFTYTRATSEYSALWRQEDIRRHAVRSVAESLFAACPQAPRILLCLDSDIPAGVLDEDLFVSVPVGRVVVGKRADVAAVGSEGLTVSWLPAEPQADCAENRLFAELVRRNLVMDGFDRATRGLREAYSETTAA